MHYLVPFKCFHHVITATYDRVEQLQQGQFIDPTPGSQLLPGRIEIDCFEHYADYHVHYFTYGAIEWSPVHGNINRDYYTTVPDLATTYNTFGFEYTPDYLNYFFNGTLLKTVDMREQTPHDFYLWLTTIANKPDATDSAGSVYFDYLRCYEISPANYNTRKVPFIQHLDSLRGTTQSAGHDLWINASITGTPQVLATAATNTLIRGIALTPGSTSLSSLLTLHQRRIRIGQRK